MARSSAPVAGRGTCQRWAWPSQQLREPCDDPGCLRQRHAGLGSAQPGVDAPEDFCFGWRLYVVQRLCVLDQMAGEVFAQFVARAHAVGFFSQAPPGVAVHRHEGRRYVDLIVVVHGSWWMGCSRRCGGACLSGLQHVCGFTAGVRPARGLQLLVRNGGGLGEPAQQLPQPGFDVGLEARGQRHEPPGRILGEMPQRGGFIHQVAHV